jgi:general secretion pathway protein E
MILELMRMSEATDRLVLRHADAREIRTEAVRGGMLTMYAHGLKKALAGITTLEEVIRVTHDA